MCVVGGGGCTLSLKPSVTATPSPGAQTFAPLRNSTHVAFSARTPLSNLLKLGVEIPIWRETCRESCVDSQFLKCCNKSRHIVKDLYLTVIGFNLSGSWGSEPDWYCQLSQTMGKKLPMNPLLKFFAFLMFMRSLKFARPRICLACTNLNQCLHVSLELLWFGGKTS